MSLSLIWGDLRDICRRRMDPDSTSTKPHLHAGTANVYKHQNLIVKTGTEASPLGSIQLGPLRLPSPTDLQQNG